MPSTRRVVITGVGSGIGRATALAFAADGGRVAGLDHTSDPALLERLADEIRDAGGEPLLRRGSTASTADIDGLADAAAEAWGGIDVWVNGAARLFVEPFLETSDEDWSAVLDTNLLGYVRGCRAAARHMVAAGSGAIINIGSAVETLPPTDMSVYVTAKGAVTGLTRALAVELGPAGVRVNVVAPGATETPLNARSWTEEVRATYRERIPMRRIADPVDIADAIVALSADGTRYLTGQVIFVDGGLTLDGSVGHRRQE